MSGPGKQKNTISPAWLTGEGASDGGKSAESSNGNGSSDAASGSSAVGVKNETTQPKAEPSKPKFAPKVPVKKEPSAVPTTSNSNSSDPSADANKTDSNKNGEKKWKQNGNNNKSIRIDKFQPKGKSVGFSDQAHQGNRKWVMPVGAAFFTGTNSVGGGSSTSFGGGGGSALKVGGVPVPLAPGAASATGPGGATRIARPNEQITEVPTARVVKSVSNSSFVSYTGQQESDSDADDPDAPEDIEDATMMTNEVWPPLDYDPLAPLALPLGPKSLTMRNMLAAEPILADPQDEAALEKEQASSLFVMQMPSDLHLEKMVERLDSSNNKDSGEENKLKIGKMQLLRSGKVRLVTLDGKTYDVNSGMASSFVQILTAMEIPADPSKTDPTGAALHSASGAAGAVGASAGSTGAGKGKGAVEAPPAPKGVMSLMGSVTKKLVITPAHDIGVRRRRRYSTTSGAHHAAGVPGESVFAAAAATLNKQYPEDDEVIMMDS